jgi:hypothetical protein
VPQAEIVCGRVRDDVDRMAAQPDRPALRLLSGPTACMTASQCSMVWGIGPPHVSVVVLAPWARATCHGPRPSRSQGEVVLGGDLSCEVATCRARWRHVAGIPLVENWSEMLPTGRRLDILPVWVF